MLERPADYQVEVNPRTGVLIARTRTGFMNLSQSGERRAVR